MSKKRRRKDSDQFKINIGTIFFCVILIYFKTSFSNAKQVIVTDVYAASEDEIEGITGENFAKEIDAKHLSGSIEDVSKKLYPVLKEGNIVIGLGAGTITALGKYLKEESLANRV